MTASIALRLVTLLVWLIAAGCIYLFLLNRVLLQLHDRRHKRLIIYGSFVVIMSVAALAGCATGVSIWLVLPGLALLAVIAGEARRWSIRRRQRGSDPVERWGARIILSRPITTSDLALVRYEVRSPRWMGPDLRIAHLSDLHIDDNLSDDYYRAVLARACRTDPHLIVFTGDFISHLEHAGRLPAVLEGLRAPLGVWAVLGNHDFWAGPGAVRAALRRAHVQVLGNGYQTLCYGAGSLLLCGCESPWGHDHWQAPEVGPQQLPLVLTHTPDNVYRLSRAGMSIIFAGHYHAGQIRVPALGSLVVPSRYGRRFDHGHFVVGGAHLFVSAGIGSADPPYRLYCPPDVFIVDIKAP